SDGGFNWRGVAARSANTKKPRRTTAPARLCYSIRWRLTSRRFRLRAQVAAMFTVGFGQPRREEVFLHPVDDAIRDLALTAPTPTAQEQRSVACLTCPDQSLIPHPNQLNAPLVTVRDAEGGVIPLAVAFSKRPGKDVFRIILIRYDDDRQFLFHDLR